MMKLLSLLLFVNTAYASFLDPKTKGQEESSKVSTKTLEAPNKQLTTTGTKTRLLETGNNNLLENGSFEHSTAATGWSSTVVTPAESTTTVVHGKKSLCFTASSQAFTLSQYSTLYASEMSGAVQGLATIRAKSNHTGAITVCHGVNGSATSNCVTVSADNKWGLYKIPFIFGSTSNGISVSAASGTGTTCLDEAKVEAVDILDTQPIMGPKTSYTPTFTNWTGSSTNCSYTQEGMWIWIDCNFVAGSVAGSEARVSLPNSWTSATTDTLKVVGFGNGSAATGRIASVLIESGSSYLTFGFSDGSGGGNLLSKANSNAIAANGSTQSFFAKVPITQLQGSTNSYTSACGANCVDVYSARIANNGTASITSQNVTWISSVSRFGAGEVQLNLVSGLITQNLSCSATNDDSANVIDTSIQYVSTTQINVRTDTNASAGFDDDFTIICQKQGADFTATRTIYGTFKDVVTTPGSGKPSMVSFEVSSTGTVSNELGNPVNGNCSVSDTSLYTCTWNTSFWATAPNCTPNTTNASQNFKADKEAVPTTTSGVFRTANSTSGAKAASGFTVVCHGVIN